MQKLLQGIFFGLILIIPACMENKANKNAKEINIRKGALEVLITKRAFLFPIKEKIIRSSDNKIISWIIEDGKDVKRGDKLVELESSDIANRMLKYESHYLIKRSELERIKANNSRRLQIARYGLSNAKFQMKISNIILAHLKSGAFIEEEDKIKAKFHLKEASLNVKSKRQNLKRSKKLVKSGSISLESFEEKKIENRLAKINRKQARLMLKKILQGATKYDIKEHELTLKLAKINMKNAQKFFNAIQKRIKQITMRHKRKVRKVRRRFKKFQKKLKSLTLYAPMRGKVLRKFYRGKKIRAGIQAWKGLPLISIPMEKRMKVVIKVGENRITQVKKGQRVRIYIAGSKKVFWGKVRKIAILAKDDFEDYDQNTKNLIGKAQKRVFDITIFLDKAWPELLPQMSVKVELIIGKTTNAVLCPRIAIYPQNTVQVVTQQGIQKRKVVLGLRSKYFVEIKKGLKEGDTVLLSDQRMH